MHLCVVRISHSANILMPVLRVFGRISLKSSEHSAVESLDMPVRLSVVCLAEQGAYAESPAHSLEELCPELRTVVGHNPRRRAVIKTPVVNKGVGHSCGGDRLEWYCTCELSIAAAYFENMHVTLPGTR